MVTATLILKSRPWLPVVVLPYLLHNVLTPPVAVSPSGESLTLDHAVTWVTVIFPFLFSVIPSVAWSGWGTQLEVNRYGLGPEYYHFFLCFRVSNVSGEISLWTVPQPRNPQPSACFHIPWITSGSSLLLSYAHALTRFWLHWVVASVKTCGRPFLSLVVRKQLSAYIMQKEGAPSLPS